MFLGVLTQMLLKRKERYVMRIIKEFYIVGTLDEYPERIEEFLIHDFKERNEYLSIDSIHIEEIRKGYLITTYVSYPEIYKDDGVDNPVREQLSKAYINYKMELGISKNTGWRF